MFRQFVWDYFPEFVKALHSQLESDNRRWGDTWKERSIENQEERIFSHIQDYRDQFEKGGQPVPWLKIAGLALIGWIRDFEATRNKSS